MGFVASSIGARIDVEHPHRALPADDRFFLFHHAVFTLTSERFWRSTARTTITVPTLIASLVNAVIAIGLFPLLDRFRKPS